MYKLKIIVASTRPGRKGIYVADWFAEVVKAYSDFDAEILDLAKINLPFLDEPKHPRLQQYENEHTKAWAAKINEADAYICIIPEYNFGAPPALINAVDFVYKEWNYKPIGIISYGGISGGLRSAQMCKEVFSTVKMVPLMESVPLPFFEKKIDENGKFIADELIGKSVKNMMTELLKWTKGLKQMRETN